MNKSLWKKRFTQKEIENLNDSEVRDIGITLSEYISDADKAYHAEDAPKLTDAEYDVLKFNLNTFEKFVPNFFNTIG